MSAIEQVDLFPETPEKVIGTYTPFFAGQKVTAEDLNKWFAVLISQGDYNTDWLKLVSTDAQAAINQALSDIVYLTEIAVPGSGTSLASRIAVVEAAVTALQTALGIANTNITGLQTTLLNKVNITDASATAGLISAYKNIGGSL